MECFVDVGLKYIGVSPGKLCFTEILGQCTMFSWWDVLVIAPIWSDHKGKSPWLPLAKAACLLWQLELHAHLGDKYATSADTTVLLLSVGI